MNNKTKLIIIIILLILCVGCGIYSFTNNGSGSRKIITKYLTNSNTTVDFYDENLKVVKSISRGIEVSLTNGEDKKDSENNILKQITYDKINYYVYETNLTSNKNNIATEQKIFVRTSATIKEDLNSSKIIGLAKKGDELEVTGYNGINKEGIVDSYKVKYNDQEGYIYGKYTTLDKDNALAYYEQEKYHDLHLTRGDSLGAGNAGNLDYYPVEKPVFEDNKMPDVVYSLYLNGGRDVISRVDEYIEFAKQTKINAFVVDIKDNESPAYASDVMKEYSPTNYANASNSKEEYKQAIQKLKDAGFYVIGRITVFKDKYYAVDHPDDAIMDTRTGGPYLHANTYWPSPYKRGVWMFNVELAKEAVTEMGFNEIQFDYVRFPDRVLEYEKQGLMDFRNEYSEEKAQAIQRFLMYATDELHKLNVYVSADVFGESSWGYVTAYGQYWPAISNVVDAISAMPYTDHFERVATYWENPYQTMLNWGKTAALRQTEIATPATARTWITAYDTPYWNPTVAYNGEKLEQQIEGLYDAGLKGGYMTWNSGSSLAKYKKQASAFNRNYLD